MAEAILLDPTLELFAVLMTALFVADKNHDIIIALEMGEGIEQYFVPFPRGQAAGQHDDGFAVRQAPLTGKLDHACLGHRAGRIDGDIDATANHTQIFLIHGIGVHDVVGGELGIGDDQFALGHDGVVASLERARSAIGAVESGDEMTAGFLRRVPGAPGRRARAGMDDIDRFSLDQLDQAAGVFANLNWVFTLERQLHMTRACGLDLTQHGAARRRNQRSPSRSAQGLSNLHCGTLGAARDVELGHDLKYNGLALFPRFRGGARLGLVCHSNSAFFPGPVRR